MHTIGVARAIRAAALVVAAVVVANAVSADVPHRDRDERAASPGLGDSMPSLAINVPVTWAGCRERGIERAQPPGDDHVQLALPVQLRTESVDGRKPRVQATIASVQVKQDEASSVRARVERGRSQQAEIQLVVVTIRLTVDAPRHDNDEAPAEGSECGAVLETRL